MRIRWSRAVALILLALSMLQRSALRRFPVRVLCPHRRTQSRPRGPAEAFFRREL